MAASRIQGFLSKAWKQNTGELPPKPLEIQSSADINLGGSPPGSPLLHCYDSYWPGAPVLLVPSARHDEHYSNKPRSMRHFCNLPLESLLQAHPRVHIQFPPSPQASHTNPPQPESPQGVHFLRHYQQYRLQLRLQLLPQAYQKTRGNMLSEGITSRKLKGGGVE